MPHITINDIENIKLSIHGENVFQVKDQIHLHVGFEYDLGG
jgi:hypothetical protein